MRFAVTRAAFLTWLLSLLALGCGPEVKAETPDGVSFADYKTIGYGGLKNPPEGYERATLEPDARQAALEAAKESLAGKGWVEAPAAEADVVIYAGLGRRTQKEGFASVTGQNYEVLVQKGAIVLDAYDRRTKDCVWRGQVEDTIKPPIDDLAALRAAVTALLNEFPSPGDAP